MNIDHDTATKMLSEIHKVSVKLQLVTEQLRIFSSQLQELRNNVVLLENAHLNLAKELTK